MFHEARQKRLPVESAVYEISAKTYSEKRKEQEVFLKDYLEKPVHPSYVAFYNKVYSEVQDLVSGILKDSSATARDRANKIHSFRLSEGATVRDLLATDVFRNRTVTMDLPVPMVLNQMENQTQAPFGFRLSAYHNTLHWPQATEFLFLHEMIVGYLGNLIQHDGEIPARDLFPIPSKSYWTIPAYIVRELAVYLQRPESDVLALHFQTNEEVKASLPQNIQDLLLISAHFTLYAEVLLPSTTPGKILELVYTCFFYPSLQNLTKNPHLQLKEDAGPFTDQTLSHLLMDAGANNIRPPTESVLKVIFNKFASEIWI